MFLTSVSTGVRLGELIALEPGDLDFKGRFIDVRRSFVLGRIGTPKNGKTRRVDMSLLLADALKHHILTTKELTLKRGWKDVPSTLFYNDEGNRLDPNNLVKALFFQVPGESGAAAGAVS